MAVNVKILGVHSVYVFEKKKNTILIHKLVLYLYKLRTLWLKGNLSWASSTNSHFGLLRGL